MAEYTKNEECEELNRPETETEPREYTNVGITKEELKNPEVQGEILRTDAEDQEVNDQNTMDSNVVGYGKYSFETNEVGDEQQVTSELKNGDSPQQSTSIPVKAQAAIDQKVEIFHLVNNQENVQLSIDAKFGVENKGFSTSCANLSLGHKSSDETSTALTPLTVKPSPVEIATIIYGKTPNNDQPTSLNSQQVERGGWSNEWDFLFSCISVSVGLGNIWRFPYLCFKNGGGTFLVTYFIAMVFCGIPIFYQEVAIGQYLGVGGMTLVAELAPIMKGVGYATMTVVFLIDIYYSIIIAWTLFYLIASFTALPGLPWQSCENSWNTLNCFLPTSNISILHNDSVSAVEEFWSRRVLAITDGIDNAGAMRWELFGVLILSWMFVYFIIWKGINQSGYIIWFTALFPYVILCVLVVRAVTLDGASDGLLYYITPKWDLLLTSGPWIDGATQIFFAYSIGTGALPALGSYNKFNHNCYRDAIITCIVNTFTCLIAGVVTFSILGNIASATNSSIESVVSSGPGLVFITYPEVVLRLPGAPIWAILFFIMLAILGIDSEFCMIEAFVTGIVDNWPNQLRKYRRLFVVSTIIVIFLLSLPMITEGGVYLFQVMDYYSASGMSMLFLVFFQTISINWIFGGKRFCSCIEEMLGKKSSWFLYVCWVFLAPAVMLGIFVFSIVQYTPVTYGSDYQYPKWAEILGICISLSSMLWIPLYIVYYILTTPGTLREVLTKGVTPVFKIRIESASASKQPVEREFEHESFPAVAKNELDPVSKSTTLLVDP
ncbi:sodium- and chloride-dependent GABA transporter 1-like [Daphnia pulicaria]|uniref:sodium- and chloride-dependent GABA transporter 1-like n=1 Tax=Daphnia pulicaria TaxID=35523 RepID=UPI001EEB6D87|nr:sodium- and chloride-dependent GABA transporter 1-like [Daphnia pulicaria]